MHRSHRGRACQADPARSYCEDIVTLTFVLMHNVDKIYVKFELFYDFAFCSSYEQIDKLTDGRTDGRTDARVVHNA